ncbi:hypothetical protein [Streptomyces sp. ME19-01-6]|uniref:hypothetical protein n=1 Tax=Streptomyces sp. ME19-01-6 TaxID=3028686 RepID=UPI0029C9CCD3|nr:hypothetical protein [Streptomyces sp. ME19-01-6]
MDRPVPVRRPHPACDVVGTAGCFTAGLLCRFATLDHLGGRLDGLSLENLTAACAFAAHVAALTCSVPAANPPSAARQR